MKEWDYLRHFFCHDLWRYFSSHGMVQTCWHHFFMGHPLHVHMTYVCVGYLVIFLTQFLLLILQQRKRFYWELNFSFWSHKRWTWKFWVLDNSREFDVSLSLRCRCSTCLRLSLILHRNPSPLSPAGRQLVAQDIFWIKECRIRNSVHKIQNIRRIVSNELVNKCLVTFKK